MRTGSHAEEAGLGVDGAQLAVAVEAHPGDIVAHAGDLVPGQARVHHGQVGLAARAREGRCDVLLLALGVLDPENLKRTRAEREIHTILGSTFVEIITSAPGQHIFNADI